MPIDYLTQRKQREDELTGLVGGRNIADEIARARTGIKNRRAGFLGGADQLIAGIMPTGRSGTGIRSRELDLELEKDLRTQKSDLERKKFNQIFQTAYNMAEDRGMDRRQAEEFARRVAEQNTGFQFAAGEAEKTRAHSLKINELQDEYARRGVELQEAFTPEADYKAALLRVLLGTGTAIGANYMLNRGGGGATIQPGTYASRLQTEFANRDAVRPYAWNTPNTLRSRSRFGR